MTRPLEPEHATAGLPRPSDGEVSLTRGGPPPCDVSVVVPTYNRQRLLVRTLDSLAAQEAGGPSFEVLVVDNNSSDDTRAIVAAFARRWPVVRYLFEPRPGVSNARNTGVAAARAPVVAFIDDDVEASPMWVREIARAFSDHPEIDCVGGRIEPRWSAPPPEWLTPMHWGAVALQAEKGVTPYVDADNASPCLMTANFACRRSILREVGGFSSAYLRDEDRELQMRLWEAGKRGLYVGDIVVSTEVPVERLGKSYHRQFNIRVGESHARMRYRDRIDRGGRLVRHATAAPTFFGAPGFLYRSLIRHSVGWLSSAVRRKSVEAFFHETRALYFASYIWTRWRENGRTLWAAPLELARFIAAWAAQRRHRVSAQV
jgi:glucosyl-dolichyl phosphate glucuronosyltransferase